MNGFISTFKLKSNFAALRLVLYLKYDIWDVHKRFITGEVSYESTPNIWWRFGLFKTVTM